MNNESTIAYVFADAYMFKGENFNFDTCYYFEMNVIKSKLQSQYELHVYRKKEEKQPDNFWGKDILSVNVLLGENGAGKTTLLKLLANNVGNGLTAMNGEKIMYIIKNNDIYIVFSGTIDLQICLHDDISQNDVMTEKQYRKKYTYIGELFKRNFVFYTNYVGGDGISPGEYKINVGKEKDVEKAYEEAKNEGLEESLSAVYRRKRNLKLFKYINNDEFIRMSSKCKVSVPDLLKIQITHNQNLQENYCDKERFPHRCWIGKNRYKYYSVDNLEYYYEAAINAFSVSCFYYLVETNKIRLRCLEEFIGQLANTEEEDGLEIALKILKSEKYSRDSELWIECLEFVKEKSNDKEKRFVKYWQTDRELYVRWDKENYNLVSQLLEYRMDSNILSFGLTGSEKNGAYSSGEESKLFLFTSLYEALEELNKKETKTNNVLLLLDEIDAYFHPSYQINIVSELLEIIGVSYSNYNVQVVMTSNTPLEISDIPSENIIYLKDGSVQGELNRYATFGNNTCNMLKNQFYIHSTMGTFAKNKIDKVITFLKNDNSVMTDEEVKYIISIVGEPIIKKKLQEMYNKRYHKDEQKKINDYTKELLDLQKNISKSKNINIGEINNLEDELLNTIELLKAIKGENE